MLKMAVLILAFALSSSLFHPCFGQASSGWSQWSEWSNPTCSATCGTLQQKVVYRTRECSQNCNGAKRVETSLKNCDLPNCPVDGGMSPWSPWTDPPCSCSGTRVLTSYRMCDDPAPMFGGAFCTGAFQKTKMAACTVTSGTGCQHAVTMYLVIDGSNSIQENNFAIIKQSVKAFARDIIASNSTVKVGVIVYGGTIQSTLLATSNLASFDSQMDSIQYRSGGTATHAGIDHARGLLAQDPSTIAKMMVVITDGLSVYPSATNASSQRARNDGIVTIAVGVDVFVREFPSLSSLFTGELLAIAGNSSRVLVLGDFGDLTSLGTMVSAILNGENIDERWTSWSRWYDPGCPAICGKGSTRNVTRNRTCISYNRSCTGPSTESQIRFCTYPACPVNGDLSQWSQWDDPFCGVTCGIAATKVVTRTRTCTNPRPMYGGSDCTGSRRETKTSNCRLGSCPGEGLWTAWSEPACPVTCGTSATKMVTRTRPCSTFVLQQGQKICGHSLLETKTDHCVLVACPGVNNLTFIILGVALGVAGCLILVLICMACVYMRRSSRRSELDPGPTRYPPNYRSVSSRNFYKPWQTPPGVANPVYIDDYDDALKIQSTQVM